MIERRRNMHARVRLSEAGSHVEDMLLVMILMYKTGDLLLRFPFCAKQAFVSR